MKKPAQSTITFEEMNTIIWEYMAARDWHKASPRGLATSIALEASELLEHYQWSDTPVGNKQALAEELADIFIYAFQYAQVQDIDIADAIQKKLEKSAKKYPAAQFKGKKDVEKREAWMKAKLHYRKEGL